MLHTGDNLEIIKSMEDESVDLIYLDPPFFTQKDWGEYTDKWDGIDHYIKFLKKRIKEMRKILKQTGSIYLHCNERASHYIKVMLDDVFGYNNFTNEIIWYYKNSKRRGKTYFTRSHDTIFLYQKQRQMYLISKKHLFRMKAK